ncbi:hypothetical protein F4806DRAFT_504887, partial [Annulohypoxylon nitens]
AEAPVDADGFREKVILGNNYIADDGGGIFRLDDSSARDAETSQRLQDDEVIRVSPTIGFSAHLQRLRYFLSDGKIKCTRFDRQTSQIVEFKRSLTQAEIFRQQSWLAKSDHPVTEFIATYDAASIARRPEGFAPFGDAYEGNIFWTALSVIKEWPRKMAVELPLRAFPDQNAMSEVMRRLRIVGCVALVGNTIGELTPQGRRMMRLRDWFRAEGRNVDIHTAHLMASAFELPGLSANVKRVMLRLAVILEIGIDNICWKVKGSTESPTLHEIEALCAGVGARLVHKGACWVALGLYQARRDEDDISEWMSGPDSVYPVPWLGLGMHTMKRVNDLVGSLELMANVVKAREIPDTRLTDSEIRVVETQLMWAYLHRIAVFTPGSQEPKDFSSIREIIVSNDGILDFNIVRKNSPDNDKCMAVYHRMIKTPHPTARTIKNLTRIPGYCLRDIREKLNISPREAVSTTYSFHQ